MDSTHSLMFDSRRYKALRRRWNSSKSSMLSDRRPAEPDRSFETIVSAAHAIVLPWCNDGHQVCHSFHDRADVSAHAETHGLAKRLPYRELTARDKLHHG